MGSGSKSRNGLMNFIERLNGTSHRLINLLKNSRVSFGNFLQCTIKNKNSICVWIRHRITGSYRFSGTAHQFASINLIFSSNSSPANLYPCTSPWVIIIVCGVSEFSWSKFQFLAKSFAFYEVFVKILIDNRSLIKGRKKQELYVNSCNCEKKFQTDM